MSVDTQTIRFQTQGGADITEISDMVGEAIHRSQISSGIITVFCPSATSGVTTIEYEAGCVHDLVRLFEQIIPQDQEYRHNQRWGDGNGHSHVRAALLGASLTVPFVQKRLTLGTWQQIIHIDFDNRPRNRELVLQIIGD